jgi:hypothetical protein
MGEENRAGARRSRYRRFLTDMNAVAGDPELRPGAADADLAGAPVGAALARTEPARFKVCAEEIALFAPH